MKIEMNGRELNKIMNVCIPATGDSRPILDLIELVCNGGNGTATALDGFMLAQCSFSYTGDNGTICIPKHKTIANNCTITIEADEYSVSISNGQETIVRKIHQQKYIAWREAIKKRMQKKTRVTIAFDRHLLMRALECFKDDGYRSSLVVFDFAGENDAAIMRGKGARGIVLPVKMSTAFDTQDFDIDDAETKEG